MSPDSRPSDRQTPSPFRIAKQVVAAGAAVLMLGGSALFAEEEPERVPEGLVRIFAVIFVQSDGTAACTISGTIPVGVTGILASRATAAFSETGICSSPPGMARGSVQVFADQTQARVICSAHVVDATNPAPTFVLALRTEAR